MKLKLFLIILLIILILSGCTTKYIKQPLATPPDKYIPQTIKTEKDFLLEYRNALKNIKQWERWYNIQVGTNYFN